MSHESAYNKRLTAETKMDKVEGVLDHLNLPPKVIEFIRSNNRALLIAIIVFVTAVVFWSFYGSYKDRVREEAASALSQAMLQEASLRSDALSKVTEQYGSTTSGLWAKVELAHLDMQKSDYEQAAVKYGALLSSLGAKDPLYPLVLFGLAQAFEASEKYPDAGKNYDLLKEIDGYKHIGYMSLGRLEEAQHNDDKAIAIYNNFILSAGDDPSFAQSRTEIMSRIAMLKAKR